MSGITLNQILRSINVYTNIIIEDEFARNYVQGTPAEFLGAETSHRSWLKLNNTQLEQTYDYIRVTSRGTLVIGMNCEKFDEHFRNIIEEN